MTFTFSETLDTQVSRVRSHIGDTDSSRPQLSDEEITAIAADAGNDWLAAAECLERILAGWETSREMAEVLDIGDSSREFDVEAGPESIRKRIGLLRATGLRNAGVSLVKVIGST